MNGFTYDPTPPTGNSLCSDKSFFMNPHDSSFIKQYLKSDMKPKTEMKSDDVVMVKRKRTNPFNDVSILSVKRVTQKDPKKAVNNDQKTVTTTKDFIPNHSFASRTLPASMKSSGPTLSPQQSQMLQWVLAGHNVFFTGSAGSGKSFLLREIVRVLKAKYGSSVVAVTASTGIAACNIGGCTLHSFAGCGLGVGSDKELFAKVSSRTQSANRWIGTKVLIIDEISMTDGHFLNKLDYIARKIRNQPRVSFGGLQMIICGDFLQLPPVSKDAAAFFAFESKAWQEMNLKILELGQVFRQSDPVFLQILSEMRQANLSDKSERILKSLDRTPKIGQDVELTHLYPLRYQVDVHNSSKLASIPGPEVVLESSDWARYPADLVKLDSYTIAPKVLTIKIGAQVMLIKNLAPYVNGSIGIVTKIGDTSISVKFFDNVTAELESKEFELNREEWKIENAEKETILRRVQYPLLLSYAITIHKSQGQTLPFVKMDLGRVFEQGQAYVAISRATCMEHLQILNFSKKVVNANKKVIDFHASLGIS